MKNSLKNLGEKLFSPEKSDKWYRRIALSVAVSAMAVLGYANSQKSHNLHDETQHTHVATFHLDRTNPEEVYPKVPSTAELTGGLEQSLSRIAQFLGGDMKNDEIKDFIKNLDLEKSYGHSLTMISLLQGLLSDDQEVRNNALVATSIAIADHQKLSAMQENGAEDLEIFAEAAKVAYYGLCADAVCAYSGGGDCVARAKSIGGKLHDLGYAVFSQVVTKFDPDTGYQNGHERVIVVDRLGFYWVIDGEVFPLADEEKVDLVPIRERVVEGAILKTELRIPQIGLEDEMANENKKWESGIANSSDLERAIVPVHTMPPDHKEDSPSSSEESYSPNISRDQILWIKALIASDKGDKFKALEDKANLLYRTAMQTFTKLEDFEKMFNSYMQYREFLEVVRNTTGYKIPTNGLFFDGSVKFPVNADDSAQLQRLQSLGNTVGLVYGSAVFINHKPSSEELNFLLTIFSPRILHFNDGLPEEFDTNNFKELAEKYIGSVTIRSQLTEDQSQLLKTMKGNEIDVEGTDSALIKSLSEIPKNYFTFYLDKKTTDKEMKELAKFINSNSFSPVKINSGRETNQSLGELLNEVKPSKPIILNFKANLPDLEQRLTIVASNHTKVFRINIEGLPDPNKQIFLFDQNMGEADVVIDIPQKVLSIEALNFLIKLRYKQRSKFYVNINFQDIDEDAAEVLADMDQNERRTFLYEIGVEDPWNERSIRLMNPQAYKLLQADLEAVVHAYVTNTSVK